MWEDVDVTAVELDNERANYYRHLFPDDDVLELDAHEYLIENYMNFDFIWSSPPCPTHSRFNLPLKKKRYPDMSLYQQIILLSSFYNGKYAIENVRGYYEPLIKPKTIDGHYYWTNFNTTNNSNFRLINSMTIEEMATERLIDIEEMKNFISKDKIEVTIRNCVLPKTGLYILNCARNIITKSNINQLGIFE